MMDFKIEKKGYSPAQVESYVEQLKRDYESTLAEQKERIIELRNQLAAAEKDLKAAREKSSLVSKAILSAVAKADEIERLSQLKYNQEILQLKAFHDKWTDYYNKILDRYPLDDQLAAAGRFNSQMAKILSRVDESNENLSTLFPVSDAEKSFKKESDRLAETQIGYIKVKTGDAPQEDDTEILDEIVPGADPNSPILSGNFDPIERISRYLNSDISRTQQASGRPAPVREDVSENPTAPPLRQSAVPPFASQPSSAPRGDYNDRTPSGFSFEEALNPKEDLADIMRDLGLLMDE